MKDTSSFISVATESQRITFIDLLCLHAKRGTIISFYSFNDAGKRDP